MPASLAHHHPRPPHGRRARCGAPPACGTPTSASRSSRSPTP